MKTTLKVSKNSHQDKIWLPNKLQQHKAKAPQLQESNRSLGKTPTGQHREQRIESFCLQKSKANSFTDILASSTEKTLQSISAMTASFTYMITLLSALSTNVRIVRL